MLGMESISRSVKRIQELIKEIFTAQFITDIHQAGANANIIIENIRMLAEDANEQQLITKVNDALSNFTTTSVSLAGFLNVSKNIVNYGVPGFLISHTIHNALKVYTEKKEKEWLKKLLRINAEQLYNSIIQLRQTALQNLIIYRQNFPEANRREQIDELIEENIEETINILLHTSSASTQKIEEIQNCAENILDHLYQEELQNGNIEEYLDRITQITDWDKIIDKLANYISAWKILSQLGMNKIELLDFECEKLSYNLAKKLYNKDNLIATIMQNLKEEFKRNGGNQLYYNIADNKKYKGWEVFSLVIKEITKENSSFDILENEQEKNSAKLLKSVYLNATNLVQELWLRQLNRPSELAESLPLEVRIVIVNRAFIGFFTETVENFFMPYMIPREAINIVYRDMPRNLITSVLAPLSVLLLPFVTSYVIYQNGGIVNTIKLIANNYI